MSILELNYRVLTSVVLLVCCADHHRCTGTSNGYTCLPCANVFCPHGQYRTGTCASTQNGYECKAGLEVFVPKYFIKLIENPAT